jgi:F-type H+-transporting ATPase subunit a
MQPYQSLRRARVFLGLVFLCLCCAGGAAPAAAAQEHHGRQQEARSQEDHAQEGGSEKSSEEGGESSFSALDHTVDTPYVEFPPFTGAVELPRLFITQQGDGSWGLDGYWSTRQAVQSGKYGLRHETGEEGSALVKSQKKIDEMVAHEGHLHADVAALGGRQIAVDLSMTKHLFYGLFAMVLTLVIFIGLARRYRRGVGRKTAPKGLWQNALEAMVIFVRDDLARPSLGEKHKRFLPFLLTVFFFILIGNLFAIIPYTASPTANISVTLALALFTFVIGQVYASKAHWEELFTGPPDVPVLVRIIMVPIEIVGLIVRHFALAVRLFANMMAGTLVVFSLIGLIFLFNSLFGTAVAWASTPVSVAFTLFILSIKLLVAFIQAYVFTMLSAIFIGMAVEEHHGAEEEPPEAPPSSETGEVTPAVHGDGASEHRSRERQPVPAAAGG